MQVELAQLQYLLPRLVGKGIILSRLGGGIGTRGPGEQKLEVDRRQIRRRIAKLNSDLKQYSLHRQTMKKKRKENAIASVALVGYTSAGKSTLLNSPI
jgi:GTP-binding protein HflX